jgi:hypothetical protein
VNLIYTFTNLYNDAFAYKSRVGLTASRVFGDALEVHLEAMGQLGSTKLTVEGMTVTRSQLDSATPHVHGLGGARYTFEDDALLGADYVLYTDGYSDSEWRAALRALALARRLSLPPALFRPSAPAGSPQRFMFAPLRRHYLFAYYSKPHLRDDFTLTVTVFGSLHDYSGSVAPQVRWSAREWLHLTLHLFAPIPAARPTEVDGEHFGEFGLAPADWRAMLSARLYY